jgi:hypothetical protein
VTVFILTSCATQKKQPLYTDWIKDCIVITGQDNNNIDLTKLIENLKMEILSDSSKYLKSDIVFTVMGRQNKNAYSKLFIINNKYTYKIDIIDTDLLKEFANEILDKNKIEQICIYDKKMSSALFGEQGKNGVVLIEFYEGIKFNPEVAGLELAKDRTSGDNFTRRKESELIIRY